MTKLSRYLVIGAVSVVSLFLLWKIMKVLFVVGLIGVVLYVGYEILSAIEEKRKMVLGYEMDEVKAKKRDLWEEMNESNTKSEDEEVYKATQLGINRKEFATLRSLYNMSRSDNENEQELARRGLDKKLIAAKVEESKFIEVLYAEYD